VSEIAALARLLADPDPGIATALRRQLAGRAEDPPGLRDAIETLPDAAERARAREARLEACRERAAEHLIALAKRGDPDLEEGALAIARLEDPDVDVAPPRARLDELGRFASAMLEGLPPGAAARERLLVLARLLGEREGFEGDRSDETVHLASSLPLVLERRKGLPIALSVVYLLVAKRAGIELAGVGAPLHFLVGGPAGGQTLYLDPFARGKSLEPAEAALFLRSMGVVFRPEHLAPVGARAIVARMARNLVSFWAKRPRGEARARRYARVANGVEPS
jgi:regulator of sirC expression with transglutaminase-like and TPR domain